MPVEEITRQVIELTPEERAEVYDFIGYIRHRGAAGKIRRSEESLRDAPDTGFAASETDNLEQKRELGKYSDKVIYRSEDFFEPLDCWGDLV